MYSLADLKSILEADLNGGREPAPKKIIASLETGLFCPLI